MSTPNLCSSNSRTNVSLDSSTKAIVISNGNPRPDSARPDSPKPEDYSESVKLTYEVTDLKQ